MIVQCCLIGLINSLVSAADARWSSGTASCMESGAVGATGQRSANPRSSQCDLKYACAARRSGAVPPAASAVHQRPSSPQPCQPAARPMCLTVKAADRTILAMCAAGFTAAVVSITQLAKWPVVLQQDHSGEPDYAKTKAAFILGLAASAASLVIGLVRLRLSSAQHSKTVRLMFVSSLLASFLCLLVAVAVWGDFVSHGDANQEHRNSLRWSYWVAVAASVLQFLAFLLYIMRSDFKQEELQEAKP